MNTTPEQSEDRIEHLVLEAQRQAPLDVAKNLMDESDETIGAVLKQMHPAPAYRILLRFVWGYRPRAKMPGVCVSERVGQWVAFQDSVDDVSGEIPDSRRLFGRR